MGYPLTILKRIMPHAEFLGWCQFYAQDPFDDQRCFDRPAAAVQALLFNINRGNNAEPQAPERFLPYPHDRDGEELDVDTQVLRNL